ncbi:restriction endonuclease subunit S [Leuconostoc lactis]|uniref:restriction endonuclease subunit S n=1 Tax=Leuconostoc lactis TaxID=1246 RepID=UPI0021C04F97|nr:restriction endonuclease subunit S [Leuconostoc lactis]MCT8387953.1 restriction endonuclease subunit S [Leuconostoc lactis]
MADSKRKAPKLRFPGFNDDWEQRELKKSTKLITKGTTPRDKSGKGTINFIKVENIVNGKIHPGSYINIEEHNGYLKRSKLEENDLLFSIAGTLGRSALVDKSILPANTNQALAIIRGYEFDPYFLITSLSGKVVKDYIRKNPTVGAQPNLSLEQIGNLILSTPVIKEQEKIGLFFKQLDDLITLHQRKLSDVQKLKSGLLQKMFPKNGEKVPEIRFPEFSDDWEQRKLGEMGNTFTGLSGKTKEDFGHGNAKFVTYMNVFGNAISDSNLVENVEIDNKQIQVEYGDVFFTTSSETPEEVGMSSVWMENIENVYLNSFCFGWRPKEKLDPNYLAFMLRSPAIRMQFMLLAQGISRYNISKKKVMEMPVPVPEFKEQRTIGKFFKQLDDLITLHQRKLEHLQQQKKALLQQMFI